MQCIQCPCEDVSPYITYISYNAMFSYRSLKDINYCAVDGAIDDRFIVVLCGNNVDVVYTVSLVAVIGRGVCPLLQKPVLP